MERTSSPAARPFGRLVTLAALLLISVAGLAVSRIWLARRPPEPARSAPVADLLRIYLSRIKSDPTDVQAYVELGKLDERREFYTSALRRLYTARALGAPDREIALPIGRSLSHLARTDDALRELNAAMKQMPDSVEAVANLAGAYFAAGDGPDASRVLKEFIQRHRSPDGSIRLSADALRRLMLCFSDARDNANAAVVAHSVRNLDPNDAGAWAIEGHALVLAGFYLESLPMLEKALALDPSVAPVCYNYAIALEQCGRTDEALKQLRRCVELSPNATDAFAELASIYQQRRDWNLAALAISRVAARSEQDTRILYRAGKLNERAGRKDLANYWYTKSALAAGQHGDALKYAGRLAQSKDPRWRAEGLMASGAAYRGMHRMKEYVDAVTRASQSGTAEDDVNIADACEKADLLEKQVEYLRKAMERDPSTGPAMRYRIAQTLSKRGLRDDAEHEIEQAIAAEPGNAAYHSQLGRLYFERRTLGGRLQKAIAEFRETVRLDPKDASSYQDLGIAYSAAGDYARAAPILEHAIDLQPGYGPSYLELGRAYARLGDRTSSDNMMALYRRYVGYDLKLKTLSARASQNRKDAGAQIALADLQAGSGDLAGAMESYSAALAIAPNDSTIRRKYDRVMQLLLQHKPAQPARRK